MKIDAVSVTSRNLKKSVEFYSLLGFTFAEFGAEEKHVEPMQKAGEARLMIDAADLIESITGVAPVAPNHSSFAIVCDSPANVDAVVKKIQDSGFVVKKQPWDAFWGQRYAIVQDPDGYLVDLFAAL
jgi:catechol 2,3-dioxygenase-like lactoylglutathione lyase family enzyme